MLVTIEYQIRPKDRIAFTQAIHRAREMRMRNGAIRWGVFQDARQPERFVETFVVDSWLDFLRQRERFSAPDRAIRDQAWSFHQGGSPPTISYMFYAKESAP